MTTREIFLNSPHKESHQRWVETAAADAARDAAILLLVQEQPEVRTLDQGWDAHSKIIGAKRVLEILFNLHLPQETAKTTQFKNLKPPS